RDHENVRFDVMMLTAEPLSGSAEPGRGLLHDHQGSDFLGERLQPLQIPRWRNDYATGGENQFNDDGCDVAGTRQSRLDGTVQAHEIALWVMALHRAMKAVRSKKSEALGNRGAGAMPVIRRKDGS